MSNEKSQSEGRSFVSQGNSHDKQLICDSLLGLAYDHGEGELDDHMSCRETYSWLTNSKQMWTMQMIKRTKLCLSRYMKKNSKGSSDIF